jgi:hypothetical protein
MTPYQRQPPACEPVKYVVRFPRPNPDLGKQFRRNHLSRPDLDEVKCSTSQPARFQRRLQEKEGHWLKLVSGLVMIGLGIYLSLSQLLVI